MRKLFTILLILGVATLPVFAGAITDLGLFNTGSAGWKVGVVAATTATSVPGGGNPWADNTTGASRWISTQAAADLITDGASQLAASNYTFQFTVPSTYVLSSIVIHGRWALDDFGTASAGSTVFSTMPDDGSHFLQSAFAAQTFTIDSTKGLVMGLNTLTFAVTNKWQQEGKVNPTGLRVEFTSADGTLAQIPEPGTLALLGGGLLALGFFRRRR